MNIILRRSGLIIFLLFALVLSIKAQQNRFIYIQTESKQTFYVKMDKKILSSSASGYIIISKLIDSTYNISFGFPKNEWPEQNVTIMVTGADAGYLLKNFENKGWGLLNLQTQQVLMPERKPQDPQASDTQFNEDAFSNILSAVVNDPSIRQKRVIIKDTITADNTITGSLEVKPVIKDTASVNIAVVVKNETKETINKQKTDLQDTAFVDKAAMINTKLNPGNKDETAPLVVQEKKTIEKNKIAISKLNADTAVDGIRMAYLDISKQNVDTVKVFIPFNDKSINKESVIVVENKIEKPAVKPVLIQPKAESKNKDSRFIDMELPNPNLKQEINSPKADTIMIAEKQPVETELAADSSKNELESKVKMVKSDCKILATHDEFLELRKIMAAENTDEAMKNAARKQFKNSCFTTEQIKNLGVLFITEEEKYKFYVAAYPFVSDSQNFGLLQQELKDNYFVIRFRAMLNQQ
jgi:hypothetical protein